MDKKNMLNKDMGKRDKVKNKMDKKKDAKKKIGKQKVARSVEQKKNEQSEVDQTELDTENMYKKSQFLCRLEGQFYEIKLIMLFVIRAIISGYKFKLASQMDMVGAFDDIVMKIDIDNLTSNTVFLQAKHTTETEKYKITGLEKENGDYSLFKYFKSYKKIMSNELLKGCFNVNDAEFIIYTNTYFNKNSLNYVTDKVKESDVFSILASTGVIVFKIKYEMFEEIFRLFENFVMNQQDCKLESTEPKKKKAKCEEITKTLIKDEVYDYLKKLTFLVNQGSESEVEIKIKDNISSRFDEHNIEERNDNYLKSSKDYQTWWQKKDYVKYLTQNDDFFQTHSSICLLDKLRNLKTQYENFISSKCLVFNDSYLAGFEKDIPQADSVVLQAVFGGEMLTVAKVLQTYKTNNGIMFVDSDFVKQFSDKIECNFNYSEVKNTLVYYVNNNKKELQFVTKMLDIVKLNCKKRLIVICNEQLNCNILVALKDNIRYCDLSSNAQKHVANSIIIFQDRNMYLKEIVGDCPNELLNDQLLAKVLLQESVEIAKRQNEDTGKLFYIPRKFKKQLLDTNIIYNCRDNVILLQASESDCQIISRRREIKFYPQSDPNRKNVYFILPSNYKFKVFQEICEKQTDVHLLEYNNNQLRWLQSQGSMTFILKSLKGDIVLTESEIVNCCHKEKLVVISDIAGMGKSTVLKSLANVVNEKYPGLWILKIKLSQHTEILQNINESKAKQTVCKIICNSLTYSSENEKTFLYSMFEAGRVAVFIDGFDEISPDYEHIVIDLVKELQIFNVQQIYLTTRPQMREYIEINLSTISYTLVALDTKEQVNLLSSEWIRNENNTDEKRQELIQNFSQTLIAKLSSMSLHQDIAICGIPLQLRMILEIYPTFKKGNKIFQNNKPHITLESLYETFVKRKMHIYSVEKLGLTPSSVAYKKELKKQINSTLEEHQLIAIDLLFSGSNHGVLLSQKDQGIFLQIFEEAHDITRYGIISAVYPNKSVFTHRTYAEYLAAMYLCSKLEKQTSTKVTAIFLTEVLVKRRFQVLRKFLNSMIDNYNICRPLLSTEYLSRRIESSDADLVTDVRVPPATLHVSARENNIKLLKYLLQDLVPESDMARLILNSYDGNYTVLQILVKSSVSSEYLDVIDRLVKLGADVKLRTSDGKSVLHLSGNNIIVLEKILSIAARNNQLKELVQNDALLGAVESSNLECVKLLIAHKANVNWKDRKNCSLLHKASTNGSMDIVKCLVEHGANINDKHDNVSSVLNVAARKGHLDIMKYLLELGANVNVEESEVISVLQEAAGNGHLDVVKYLVELGANVNENNYDSPALLEAAIFGHLDTVQYLIEHGANVNKKDDVGRTVMHEAAVEGNLDIVQYLVAHGANVNEKDNDGRSVLFEAACYGVLDRVKCFVELGANVNDKDNDGKSVLYEAARICNLDVVKYLIEQGADVNDKDNNGSTVLHEAASLSYLNIVQCLVEHGANVSSKDNKGVSVLYRAAKCGHLHIVKYLLERVACDKDSNICSVLYEAAQTGYVNTETYVLNQDINVNYKDLWSLLYFAASEGHVHIVTYLVEHGANVNDKDIRDRSVLHEAAKFGHLDTVKYLVEHGANVNDKDNDGRSVLYEAASLCYLDIVQCLVQHNANVNDKDNYGRSVLYVTAGNGNLDTLKYLVDHGGNVNDKNKYGWSVLYEAASNGTLDKVKCLIKHGANVNGKDNSGRSVLHEAAIRGNQGIVQYLVEHGANVNDKNNDGNSVLHVASSKVKTYLRANGAM